MAMPIRADLDMLVPRVLPKMLRKHIKKNRKINIKEFSKIHEYYRKNIYPRLIVKTTFLKAVQCRVNGKMI